MTATVITGTAITAFRFMSLKQMLKLEQKGMRHSGGALRPRLAAEFGLKPRASYDAYIAVCEGRIAAIKAGQS